jgi:hypothetical protein
MATAYQFRIAMHSISTDSLGSKMIHIGIGFLLFPRKRAYPGYPEAARRISFNSELDFKLIFMCMRTNRIQKGRNVRGVAISRSLVPH